MRDLSAAEVTPMDPRLFDVLFQVAHRLGALEREYVIHSGYLHAGDQRHPPAPVAPGGADLPATTSGVHGLRLPAGGLRSPGAGAQRRGDAAGPGWATTAKGFVHLDCGPVRRW